MAANEGIIRDIEGGQELESTKVLCFYDKDTRDQLQAFWVALGEAAAKLGISKSEARAFLKAWRKIAGESAMTHAREFTARTVAQRGARGGSGNMMGHISRF